MNGDDLWMHPCAGVLVRVAREKSPERMIEAPAEKLQAVLDKAWREFGDPAKVMTDPTPFFASSSPYLQPSSRPTSAPIGPRRRRA